MNLGGGAFFWSKSFERNYAPAALFFHYKNFAPAALFFANIFAPAALIYMSGVQCCVKILSLTTIDDRQEEKKRRSIETQH